MTLNLAFLAAWREQILRFMRYEQSEKFLPAAKTLKYSSKHLQSILSNRSSLRPQRLGGERHGCLKTQEIEGGF